MMERKVMLVPQAILESVEKLALRDHQESK